MRNWSVHSYCLKVHSPLNRMPLLVPTRPHKAGLSVCTQNQWSTSTAPGDTTPRDESVTSQTGWGLVIDNYQTCVKTDWVNNWLYHFSFIGRWTKYHFWVGAVVELHGFLLYVSNGGVRTQRQDDEDDACMSHTHRTHRTMDAWTHEQTMCNDGVCLDLEDSTCDIKVGGNFAVGQRKPDESHAHADGSRHIGKIIAFTWNTNRKPNHFERPTLEWRNSTPKISQIPFGLSSREEKKEVSEVIRAWYKFWNVCKTSATFCNITKRKYSPLSIAIFAKKSSKD